MRIGTRGSRLAIAQTQQVAALITAAYPNEPIELVTIHTTGDAVTDLPFSKVGTKGMFVKEIEEALLRGSIDLAIHSLKDMPGELPQGLSLAAVPRRADARDALISRAGSLNALPAGARVGTSSLRRRIQIQHSRPDVIVLELRGNLDTRLRKLDSGEYDAIVLAAAGLDRLGAADRITELLSLRDHVPAPGQGALALEICSGNVDLARMLVPLNCADTWDAVTAERAFQAGLKFGCTAPVAAHATVTANEVTLHTWIAEPDGGAGVRQEWNSGSRAQAEKVGRDAALALLDSEMGRWARLDNPTS